MKEGLTLRTQELDCLRAGATEDSCSGVQPGYVGDSSGRLLDPHMQLSENRAWNLSVPLCTERCKSPHAFCVALLGSLGNFFIKENMCMNHKVEYYFSSLISLPFSNNDSNHVRTNSPLSMFFLLFCSLPSQLIIQNQRSLPHSQHL